MKVLIVGEQGRPHALAGRSSPRASRSNGLPRAPSVPQRDDAVGELAAALIALERLFADDAPDAVLLVSASDLALAAVLVATKLQIPVAASVEAAPARTQRRR